MNMNPSIEKSPDYLSKLIETTRKALSGYAGSTVYTAGKTPIDFGILSGRKIQPLDLIPDEDIQVPELFDIATGLSRMPRFCGQTVRPYTVAEHSIWVAKGARSIAEACGLDAAAQAAAYRVGLLHDAAEAFMADVPKPLKDELETLAHGSCRTYKHLENALLSAILNKHAGGTFPELQPIIKVTDQTAFLVESRDLRSGDDLPEIAHLGRVCPIEYPDLIRDLFLIELQENP
jgi:5'-deoxynucleotidase YfbR-like HD superfamily hydrolase